MQMRTQASGCSSNLLQSVLNPSLSFLFHSQKENLPVFSVHPEDDHRVVSYNINSKEF